MAMCRHATYLMAVGQSEGNFKVAIERACHAAANQAWQHNNVSVPDILLGAKKCSSSIGISNSADSETKFRYSTPQW